MRVALYARVSTDDKGQDPLNQLAQLREFAQRQGWKIVGEYVDYVSGKNGNRDEFTRLWAGIERHSFDLVLFWALDRFTREGTLPTLQYLKRMSDAGVKFKSYTEQYIDSLGVFGDAIIGLIAAMAKQERIRISERTKAGLARVKAKGKVLGRKPAVLDMTQVRARMQAGESLRSIARALGVSAALIHKRLKLEATAVQQ